MTGMAQFAVLKRVVHFISCAQSGSFLPFKGQKVAVSYLVAGFKNKILSS